MRDYSPKNAMRILMKALTKIETVIGQLTDHFHIQKVKVKDLWHLTYRITRKILSRTICIVLNKKR